MCYFNWSSLCQTIQMLLGKRCLHIQFWNSLVGSYWNSLNNAFKIQVWLSQILAWTFLKCLSNKNKHQCDLYILYHLTHVQSPASYQPYCGLYLGHGLLWLMILTPTSGYWHMLFQWLTLSFPRIVLIECQSLSLQEKGITWWNS